MSEGKPLVEDGNTTLDKIIKYFSCFAICVLIAMLGIYFYQFHGGLGDQGQFGAFGDFFGGILNPMLTFLTILLLLRQLRYQRSELNSTAKELRATAEIHKENIAHSRAVEVFDKTEDEFKDSKTKFYTSMEKNFGFLSQNGDFAVQVLGDDSRFNVGTLRLSLITLEENFGMEGRVPIKSSDSVEFYNAYSEALYLCLINARSIYTYVSEYEKLGVNKLFYVGALKVLINTFERLEQTALLLNDGSKLDDVIERMNKLIDDYTRIISKANNTPNLD